MILVGCDSILYLSNHRRHYSATNLDDYVSFPGATAVQFAVLLHHYDLPLLFNLVRVLLHMVEDAPVVFLSDADELVEDDMGTADEFVVEQNIALHHVWILGKQRRGGMRVSRVRHETDGQTEEGNVQTRRPKLKRAD